MSTIRISRFSHFGEPATLAAGDRAGLLRFILALRSARDTGYSEFDTGDVRHRIVRRRGNANDIEVDVRTVTYRLTHATICEMVSLAEALVSVGGPGHQYVDISSPTSTLVISVDEHV